MLMRALLWDMNGVLVDDEPLQERTWTEALATAGIELEDGWWQKHFLGRRVSTTMQSLYPQVGPDEFAVLVAEKRRRYRELSALGLPAVPGAMELLGAARARGLLQALVTGASDAEMQIVLEQLDARTYFSTLISGEDVSEGKPSPDCFLLAAERLQVDAEECWVIEDSISGVAAARAAGMRCVALTTSYDAETLRSAEADVVVDELTASLAECLLGSSF